MGPSDFNFFIHIVRRVLEGYARKNVIIFSDEWEKLDQSKKQYLETSTTLHENTIEIVPGTNWSVDDIRTKSLAIKSRLGTLDFLIIDDYSHQQNDSIFSVTDLKHIKALALELNVLICFVSAHYSNREDYFTCFDGKTRLQMGMCHEIDQCSSLEELGKKYGVSIKRLHEIEEKALKTLIQKRKT